MTAILGCSQGGLQSSAIYMNIVHWLDGTQGICHMEVCHIGTCTWTLQKLTHNLYSLCFFRNNNLQQQSNLKHMIANSNNKKCFPPLPKPKANPTTTWTKKVPWTENQFTHFTFRESICSCQVFGASYLDQEVSDINDTGLHMSARKRFLFHS